eukprot:2718740-Rhodomonas_salina.2
MPENVQEQRTHRERGKGAGATCYQHLNSEYPGTWSTKQQTSAPKLVEIAAACLLLSTMTQIPETHHYESLLATHCLFSFPRNS